MDKDFNEAFWWKLCTCYLLIVLSLLTFFYRTMLENDMKSYEEYYCFNKLYMKMNYTNINDVLNDSINDIPYTTYILPFNTTKE